MINEKIDQVIKILKEKGIDVWLTFVRETEATPDPMLDLILGTGVVWPAAFLISSNGEKKAIVGTLDVQNIKDHADYDVIGYSVSIKEDLLNLLNDRDPRQIAINTSTSDVLADGLTHGMHTILCEYLAGTKFADRLISSENIVAVLRGRKSPSEVKAIQSAIKETLRIFDDVTTYVKSGMTEIQVADFIKSRMDEKGLESAWDPSQCPAVFTGPDSAGAHAQPTDRVIEPGHIMNIDFGVRVDGYVSDLQRTWYFLKSEEEEPPAEVRKGFETIRQAIRNASDILKPGMQGWEVDQAARQFIIDAGYEEFPHGLGHQVGRKAHDGSALLCPRWDRYKKLPYLKVESGQVYTIEPRLTVKGYGVATIEEIVVVTETGCEFLSTPQEELILI